MPLGLLPETTRSARGEKSSRNASCAPPHWFRAAEGVRAAWPTATGPFPRTPTRGGTPAQRLGKRYEAKALTHLAETLGPPFISSQWFRFTSGSGIRFCQVDGILHEEAATTIFEVKLRFSSDAWWQLRHLYEPVVRRAYMPKRIHLCIVCRSFDPSAPFPEPVNHLRGLNRMHLEGGGDRISLYSWKP